MKKLLLLPCIFLSCSYLLMIHFPDSPPNDMPEPNGLSFKTMVLIQAEHHFAGINQEYQWLDTYYPGYRRINQELAIQNGRLVDVLTIKTKKGETLKIYFDVTHLFMQALDGIGEKEDDHNGVDVGEKRI